VNCNACLNCHPTLQISTVAEYSYNINCQNIGLFKVHFSSQEIAGCVLGKGDVRKCSR